MMWWIRTRRVHTAMLPSLAVFGLLILLVHNISVPLPSIVGRSQVALSLFVPVPLLAGLMMCLESRLPAPEISAARRVALLDAALIVSVVVAAILLCLIAGDLLNSSQVGTVGRNGVFLIGLMLCARTIAGQTAVMVPIAWLVMVVFVGYRGPGDAYSWTILTEPAGNPHAILVTVLALMVGTALQYRATRE